MRRSARLLALVGCLSALPSLATPSFLPQGLAQEDETPPVSGLLGSSIGDIVWSGRYLWIATERGLGRLDPLTSDGRDAGDWVTFTEENGLGRGAVSALAAVGDTVWAATLFDSTIAGVQGSNQVGSGLSSSVDGGRSWHHIPNEMIFDISRPGFGRGPTTPIQNSCFGLAIDGDTIWAAFFAGSTIRSGDAGRTWERALPDGADEIVFFTSDTVADSLLILADSLDATANNAEQVSALRAAADSLARQKRLHRTFSVLAYDDTVWVGTASGLSASFDDGITWRNSRVRLDDAGTPRPGNIGADWVVSLERQRRSDGGSVIWAGTNVSEGAGQQAAISFSADDGESWRFSSPGSGPAFAWDFAFADDAVWAASDRGLFVSRDDGDSWDMAAVADVSGDVLREPFIGAETAPGLGGEQVLWVGADNGLARSFDGGDTWEIIFFPVRTRSLDRGGIIGTAGVIDPDFVATYAAPSPFAPSRGVTRLVYSLQNASDVSIDIYDFASRHVRTLLAGEARGGRQNHREIWDGRDDDDSVVANGVYFFRVETDDGAQAFGKVVVLN